MVDKKRGWHSKGDAAYNWKSNPGYRTLHKWVHNNKPGAEACEDCGRMGVKLECANVGGVYTRNLDDYRWLCRLCHMKNDGRLANLKQTEDAIKESSALLAEGMRQCIYCGEIKPVSDFALNKYRSSGLQSYCKECGKMKCKEYGIKTNWGKNLIRNSKSELI